jgi:hypothetical protein
MVLLFIGAVDAALKLVHDHLCDFVRAAVEQQLVRHETVESASGICQRASL